ncbi:MAG: universal stress protein [Roseiflexaceae bacterium]
MMTKTKVLITLDGSAWSRQILTPIRQLLAPADHELILLRVAELPIGIVGAPPRPISVGWMTTMYESRHDLEYTLHPIYDSQQELNEHAALEMTLLPDQQLLQRDGYSVTSQVRFGDPANEIAALARCANIDIVAMATHGQTGLRHLLLGSVAEQVLRDLTIPVLLIRPTDHTEDHVPAWPADRCLTAIVPLDGTPIAEQALDCATRLAACNGARLVLTAVAAMTSDDGLAEVGLAPYWVQADQEDSKLRLNEYLKQTAMRLAHRGLMVETRLSAGSPAEEILHISAAEHADLIIMSTHCRSGMARLLRGSVAASVLQHAAVPVLLAHAYTPGTSTQANERHEVSQR